MHPHHSPFDCLGGHAEERVCAREAIGAVLSWELLPTDHQACQRASIPPFESRGRLYGAFQMENLTSSRRCHRSAWPERACDTKKPEL